MNIEFSKNLIKGRIVETLFEQLLRETKQFTVLSFGYENILPELANRQKEIHIQETMEIVRRAPDFAVINNKTHDVHLIEVKYMMHPREEWILRDAKRMYDSWKPSYIFLATPHGFYFDKVSSIIDKEGIMAPLDQSLFPTELQDKYLALLNHFIQ